MEKTLHFKNGETKKVNLKIASEIRDKIDEGVIGFYFSNDDILELKILVNISEIVYID